MGCCEEKFREIDNEKSNVKRHKYKKKYMNNINKIVRIQKQKNNESYIKIDKYVKNELPNIFDNHNLSYKEDNEKENSSFYINRVLETPIQIITQSKMNKNGKFPEDKKPPHESKVIRYIKNESFSDSI